MQNFIPANISYMLFDPVPLQNLIENLVLANNMLITKNVPANNCHSKVHVLKTSLKQYYCTAGKFGRELNSPI